MLEIGKYLFYSIARKFKTFDDKSMKTRSMKDTIIGLFW